MEHTFITWVCTGHAHPHDNQKGHCCPNHGQRARLLSLLHLRDKLSSLLSLLSLLLLSLLSLLLLPLLSLQLLLLLLLLLSPLMLLSLHVSLMQAHLARAPRVPLTRVPPTADGQ